MLTFSKWGGTEEGADSEPGGTLFNGWNLHLSRVRPLTGKQKWAMAKDIEEEPT